MDKNSLDVKAETLDRLREVLPEIFSENKIDYEKLKVMLGDNLEFNNERYHLNWAGKSDAFRALQLPTAKTLIPVKAESINFDNTKNIFIEGENLEVLKALQKSYFGKVKMIYIDPPYNTGNDSFIYPDKFKQNKHEYEEDTDEFDDDGYRIDDSMFRKNSKDKGHYHSNWLNMMMPRLYLAKSLLRQDGVIFISIDDNEVHNLRMLCNEIFGEENFVSNVVRIAKTTSFRGNFFAPSKDYVLAYAKNIFELRRFVDNIDVAQYKKCDENGNLYRDDIAFYLSTLEARPNQRYYIKCPDGELVIPPGNTFPPEVPQPNDGMWRWSHDNFLQKKHLLVFKKSNRSPLLTDKQTQANWNIYTKSYLKDRLEDGGNIPRDIFENDLNRQGTSDIKTLGVVFDFPKPISLMKKLIKIANITNNDIILDFFAGSGTTAHAVMELNKEDGGSRQYICVQLPEKCAEDSEAYKAGYKTIADICKERIRRVSQNIAQEITSSELDLGFKVFKLQDSNFKQWRDDIKSETELLEQMEMFIDPVVANATTENIIYELLLKNGLDLNSKIVKHNGYFAVHNNNNQEVIILMLETQGNISENTKLHEQTIQEIIKSKPAKVIALDRIFNNGDQLKKNTALQMHDADIDFKTI